MLVNVINYDHEEHEYLLEFIAAKNGITSNGIIPSKIGFIGIVDNYPIAFGFLRDVDGQYGIIEGIMTDPDRSPARRHHALSAVINFLIDESKSLKHKLILAWTKEESILKRADDLGFNILQEHKLITLL